ncbi:hypothetical protein EST38_g14403 [Candolleomyces aberdarensis]|uniref:Nephrocystin 3-like N-terminal domain-containing protein n=1 Tax=Candolleomyces aberdarensis TaxID=2316362 RepID=A0A4Q2CYI8_9AGAR|nr:hypothetical protein EST38_g14403 [Candolleomyces aberdarensis]
MHYVDVPNATHVVTVNPPFGESVDGWELLLKNTAPNALHNSRARYDAPKCDEDTRIEVTSEIMDWIHDRGAPQRLLCMTGAAGSGKSALQQTTAEKCGRNDTLASSFFLSVADPTRNTVDLVVPTIAYQLGRTNETFKRLVGTAIEKDPLIFSQSLQDQITALIVRPFEYIRDSQADLRNIPYAILIDGLDECKGEDRQAELLIAIREVDGLPFRIFIASRPEWAIRTALEPGGHLHAVAYHIQLSNDYDASGDMRRYLWRRFKDLSFRTGNAHWFTGADIEALVQAASGQFIYVATVFKYISERRGSPAERLKIVLTWTPHDEQIACPFEALDRLYTNILSAAKNVYEAVDIHHRRDFLLLFRAYHTKSSVVPADILSVLLGLEARAEEIIVSDLRSLVALKTDSDGSLCLRLYHKSFSDFLKEESRAKDLFVPESRVYTHLAKCCMQRFIELCPLDLGSLQDKCEEVPEFHRHCLEEAIEDLPFFLPKATNIDDDVVDFTENCGWQKLDKLLPLVYGIGHWLFHYFKHWITTLYQFADDLKASPKA